ncbi:MAG: PAS domain S-box protein [Candidatus Pacebacteria bacterium]|nr:PAS domain S-box protein [Candidatus Paceibacterota bacterium]
MNMARLWRKTFSKIKEILATIWQYIFALDYVKSHKLEMSESEQKFRLIAESVNNAIITFDDAGLVVYWNKSAKRIFGYDEREVLGKSFILGKNEKENNWNVEKNTSVEIIGVRKNGEEFPLKVSYSSWKIGVKIFHTAIARDVGRYRESEQKLRDYAQKMEEGKAFDDALLLSIADGILVTDTIGRITYINKALEGLCGMKSSELLHHDLDESIPFFDEFKRRVPRDKRPIYIALDAEKRKEFSSVAKSATFYLANKKSKRLIPLSISSAPLVIDGSVRGAIGVWRDITNEKEINKAKDEFLSLAAHQLRTPLTTISLTTEMLMKNVVGDINKENRKYLKSIFKEVKNMTEMVQTFLNISRIEMGKFEIKPKPVKLFEEIEEIAEAVLPQINHKKVRFKKKYDKNLPTLNLDRRVFRIILENLLSNAIKYSRLNGQITLLAKETSNNAIIQVTDNGIGIPKKDQDKIFTKMFRAKNVSEIKSNGSGLGLYLVKNLAEQNGYKVSVKSKEGKGTTFSISLPL